MAGDPEQEAQTAGQGAETSAPSNQPPTTENPPQVEPQVDQDASQDLDSAYDTFEHGRRYHAYHDGAYLAPNDEQEQDRMDLVHHVYYLLMGGKLHLAPISPNPQRVLDLGTGTGMWAIDFADEHPSAQVIGTDLSPIQPRWLPPNCIFEIDDFEEEWVYTTPFDFIHGRELEGCIADDERLFRQAFKHLRSGGYIELQCAAPYFLSHDNTAEKAKYCQMWVKGLRDGGIKFGKPFHNVPEWKDKLKKAGFVDVQETILENAIGKWPDDPERKQAGELQEYQQIQAIESYTPAMFSRVLGWSQEEIAVLMANAKKEVKNPDLHMYIPIHVVYGRKP
ncbi:hypothetical protein VTN96DRAFT_5722 [Rasamsonia emersonii]